MKKLYLLPQDGQYYKANLHCHSTVSDGRLTPEQLRDAYRAEGYSILAITDHEVGVDHSDLNLPDFLMLTGYEISVNPVGTDYVREKVCHINLISSRPDYTKQVCYDPTHFNDYLRKSLRPEDIPEETYTRSYSPECVNEIVRQAHDKGYLCSYNHPTWSMESFAEYGQYKGFDMMEMVNNTSTVVGYDECNSHAYDEMLRAGRRLSCTCTDDNHDAFPLGDPKNDSFGGYIWLNALALDYDSVIESLRYGDFYASAGGPTISELSFDGQKVRLVCSGAREIRRISNLRSGMLSFRPGEGELLTEIESGLTDEESYFRFQLVGPDGKCSFTRAYYPDEMEQAFKKL